MEQDFRKINLFGSGLLLCKIINKSHVINRENILTWGIWGKNCENVQREWHMVVLQAANNFCTEVSREIMLKCEFSRINEKRLMFF